MGIFTELEQLLLAGYQKIIGLDLKASSSREGNTLSFAGYLLNIAVAAGASIMTGTIPTAPTARQLHG